MTTVAVNRNQLLRRRCNRMALNARVAVSGEDEKCAFTLNTKATSLNKHGAAIQLNRQLSLGSTVMVRNGQGAQAQVRVVGKVSVVGGAYTYGVEFVQADAGQGFWGITFPSA